MKFSELLTDGTKETEGVWVDVELGFRIKVGRFNNRNLRRHLLKRSQGRRATTDFAQAELTEEEDAAIVAKYILLDWEGLTEDDGRPIPYSVEKATELLTKSRDFYAIVIEESRRVDHFKAKAQEEDLKN